MKEKGVSKEFEQMVLACLNENLDDRTTACDLLNKPFSATAIERFKQFVFRGRNPSPIDNRVVEDQKRNHKFTFIWWY